MANECDEEAQGSNAKEVHEVKLMNSFERKLTRLVPHDGSRRLGYYVCGPTVYDSPHLGHARNYVSFDVIRR